MHNEEYLHLRKTPSMRTNKDKLEERQGDGQRNEGERVLGTVLVRIQTRWGKNKSFNNR